MDEAILASIDGGRYKAHVHICPSRARLVATDRAAIRVHASRVLSCFTTGWVWKWS